MSPSPAALRISGQAHRSPSLRSVVG